MLGLLHWRQGRLDEAAPLFQNAFEIGRRVLGPDHTTTLMYEMNLANVHRAKGRYKEAEPLYAHLVETQARVRGEEHVDTLNTMGNFANLLQETGRYEKAEALHRRELEIRRRVQGEKAPGTVSTMNNLANDLALLGRYDEAEPLMQRTLELKIDLYGAGPPDARSTASTAWRTFADRHGAIRGGRITASAGARRPHACPRSRRIERTINSRERLANTLSNQGRFAEAERLAATAAGAGDGEPGRAAPRHAVSARTRAPRPYSGWVAPMKPKRSCRRQLGILDEKKAGRGHRRGRRVGGDGAAAHGDGAGGAGPSRRGGGLLDRGHPQAAAAQRRHDAGRALSRRFLRGLEPRAARRRPAPPEPPSGGGVSKRSLPLPSPNRSGSPFTPAFFSESNAAVQRSLRICACPEEELGKTSTDRHPRCAASDNRASAQFAAEPQPRRARRLR